MKNIKKFMVLSFAALTLCATTLTACSGGNVKTKGVYLSPSVMSYQNMRPTYNYYLTTFTHQELTLFDNNTYCLIVSSSQFSALIISEDSNDFSGNERANYIYKYYGVYSSKVNELDEDLLDVTLKDVKRFVASYDQSYWLDTDNWTEEMGRKVIPPKGIDMTTGAPVPDEDAQPWTAAQYLATKQYAEEVDIEVNTKTCSFDFVELQFVQTQQ